MDYFDKTGYQNTNSRCTAEKSQGPDYTHAVESQIPEGEISSLTTHKKIKEVADKLLIQ